MLLNNKSVLTAGSSISSLRFRDVSEILLQKPLSWPGWDCLSGSHDLVLDPKCLSYIFPEVWNRSTGSKLIRENKTENTLSKLFNLCHSCQRYELWHSSVCFGEEQLTQSYRKGHRERGVSIDEKRRSNHEVLGNHIKKLRQYQRSIGIKIGFQSRCLHNQICIL